MLISSAITETKKRMLIEEATKNLLRLQNHPRRPELLTIIELARYETETCIGVGFFWRKLYDLDTHVLRLTRDGLDELLIKHYRYHYSQDDFGPYKSGGIETMSNLLIEVEDICELTGWYDLDPDLLQAVILKLEV